MPELRKMLTTLDELEKEIGPLLAELRTARKLENLSPLNAANSFSALVNATCKLQITKADLIDRMNNAAQSTEPEEDRTEQPDTKTQRAAEKLLVSVVKKQLAHDQAGAAS